MGAVTGNRIHAVGNLPTGDIDFSPGDYGLDPVRGWFGRPPGLGHACDLGAYSVVENEDLTITVNEGGPISVGGPQGSSGPMFTGTLINGVWSD